MSLLDEAPSQIAMPKLDATDYQISLNRWVNHTQSEKTILNYTVFTMCSCISARYTIL